MQAFGRNQTLTESRPVGSAFERHLVGAGGATAIAHIGVLRVFAQESIPIDMIVGSSMRELYSILTEQNKSGK
jgi:hypothetical protein